MLPASLLPQNSLIVLFRVDEPLDCDAFAVRPVRNQVRSELPDAPQPDSDRFSLTDFARNTHSGHARQFGVSSIDRLSKAYCRFKAGILGQISVMDNEVLPRGGALNDPGHDLWRLTFTREFHSLAFHRVELVFGHFDVRAALLSFIQQHF
jgi:hypothetical protein